MKVVNLTIAKLSLCLALGILTAHFFSNEYLLLIPLIIGCSVLALLWFIGRKQLQPSVFFGIVALFLFFGIGYVNYQLRLPQHQVDHFTHYNTPEKTQILELKIVEQLKSDRYNDKFLATVQKLDIHATAGRILLYVQKDSTTNSIQLDDEFIVLAKVGPIPSMLNPHQFDYKKYMQSLNVYAQVQLSEENFKHSKKGSPTLRGYAEKTRNFAIDKLKTAQIPLNERAILQALVLGQKRDLSSDLKQDYADAGAIHILAVSGLHVGIIFLIINFLTQPLRSIPYGRFIQPSIVLLALWGFAFLTGLSPSVCRAVTMFSFLAMAQHLGRHTYTMNTLFLSFLFLLLLQPVWLFHVGFQLSYLAVFFIVWVQPKFASLWRPRYRLVRLFWGIFTVSLAAQLGVLPLSLFYFHQLPGLFLVSNLVVLPVLGIILGLGLLVILLACANLLPQSLAGAYGFLLQKLNHFITWVAQQDRFIIKDISFSIENALTCYILIIAVIFIWKRRTFKRMLFLLGSIWIIIATLYLEKVNAPSSELIFFQRSKKTLVGITTGTQMTLLKSDTITYKSSYPIKNYLVSNKIQGFEEKALPAVFNYHRKTFLILDSLGVFPKNIHIDYIVLTGSPKINLNRLIDSLSPTLIVADGSNYYSYVNRWKNSCMQAGVPFHYTREDGAFVIKEEVVLTKMKDRFATRIKK